MDIHDLSMKYFLIDDSEIEPYVNFLNKHNYPYKFNRTKLCILLHQHINSYLNCIWSHYVQLNLFVKGENRDFIELTLIHQTVNDVITYFMLEGKNLNDIDKERLIRLYEKFMEYRKAVECYFNLSHKMK